ncbi:MAG: YkgJ family cysteine cluster protein [Candidatus Heimdallarchaeota archaeon]|nr:YkgJ family cysteine cluster protein [Candidatus Heimdallarchaeota archaeon]
MYRPDDIGDSNYVRCGFRDCYQCCLETEMIITEEEAEIIEERSGIEREEFLLPEVETEGFLQLKNVHSPIMGMRCYFLNDKGKCSIREYAPQGCYLYPLILNVETDETMVDVDCREHDWFKKQTFLASQARSIKQLVSTLMLEADRRVIDLQLSPSAASFDYFEDEETASALRELLDARSHKDDDDD